MNYGSVHVQGAGRKILEMEQDSKSHSARLLLLIWILIQIAEVFSIFPRHPSVITMSPAQGLSANK